MCLYRGMLPLGQDSMPKMQLMLTSTWRQHSVCGRKRRWGASPHCKQLTLVAVEGLVSVSCGTLPSGRGGRERERAGQTEEAALGTEWNFRTPSVGFLHSGEERETGGGRAGDRWAHPHQLALRPASARSHGNVPLSSSSQIRRLTASLLPHSPLHVPHRFYVFALCGPTQRQALRANPWRQIWSCEL